MDKEEIKLKIINKVHHYLSDKIKVTSDDQMIQIDNSIISIFKIPTIQAALDLVFEETYKELTNNKQIK